ncbi:hypothetical protein [Kaistella sp.]|uniref:hypothetical protein n=1 Tax=Kaistella sp. TaxID=2782235 RepID=UPI00359FAD32
MMKQTTLLLFFLICSTFLFAQKITEKISPEIKSDPSNIFNLKKKYFGDSIQKISSKKLDRVIALPNAFPKNPDLYLALKGKTRNDQQYKILNAIPETEKLK